MKPVRIVFMGTPDFACPCLEAMVSSGYDVVGVVTQPDRPKGRGGKLSPPPVKVLAERLGLKVLQPRRVKSPEAVDALKNLKPDLTVTCAFGQILSQEVLDTPVLGSINVHASLLPKYRGAAPIHWAVINGEEMTGVTTMWMDAGLDTGDMILREEIPIGPDETTGQVHDKLSRQGAEVLLRTLDLIARGEAPRIPQNSEEASYAPRITREHELIRWEGSSRDIVNQIRGLDPWPGAFTYLGTSPLKIWRAVPWKDKPGGQPGQVVEVIRGSGFAVATGDGAVLATEVQPENARRMPAASFLAGRRLEPGTVLGGLPAPLDRK